MTEKCDVLLLVPPNASLVRNVSSIRGTGFIPPLGLGYLGAVLERAGYQVKLVDMDAFGWGGVDLIQHVLQCQPRIVGIGAMVGSYNNGLRVAQLIRQTVPHIKIVMGGPHVTFLPEDTLDCEAIDVVVRHEGEETLLELMRYFDGEGPGLDKISGIAFRDGTRIYQTKPRRPIKDLDQLPLPARHLFKMECYSKPGVLITARGCSGQCVFCAARALYPEQVYRARSPQAVVEEICNLVEHFGIREFFIADDAFTLQAKRALKICDLLIASGIRARWTCEARVNSMSPELVEQMRAAGCCQVFYGVESGHPEILRRIRKGITLEQVEEVVNFSQAAGLNVMCSFILGFPWDTRQTIQQSIEFANKLRHLGASGPNCKPIGGRGWVTAAYYHLTPLPGTFVYEHASELGIRFVSKNWDHYSMAAPIIETEHLSVAELRDLRLCATCADNGTPRAVRSGKSEAC